MTNVKFFSAIFVLTVLFSCITFSASAQDWTVQDEVDEMTGESSWLLIGPATSPTEPMEFPYNDVTSRVVIQCSNSGGLINLYFTTAPNLTDTDVQDGYSTFSARIRWDENTPTEASFAQRWGGKHIQPIRNISISSMLNHNELLIELQWHGQGQTYFLYDLSGVENFRQRLAANRCLE